MYCVLGIRGITNLHWQDEVASWYTGNVNGMQIFTYISKGTMGTREVVPGGGPHFFLYSMYNVSL